MLAILTTVYPAALPFLDDFLEGLNNQTDGDFILFIVNDGVEGLAGLTTKQNLETRFLDASGTPASLRRQGINWVESEGAGWVIFVDADDICAAERVARTRMSINGPDCLFNDLILFGDEIPHETSLLSPHFKTDDTVRPDALVNVNFLGMSNTAVNVDLLNSSVACIPDDVVAFDWALFTRMALDGATIRYMDGAPTRYRQHDVNIAGPKDVSDSSILRGVGVKSRQYELFRSDGTPYDRLATEFAVLETRLGRDEPFFREYCHAVRENSPDYPLWWEPMKLPKELGL